jgi:nucleoside-diphosphate-sugar epimerase
MITFISADDAAKALYKLSQNEFIGPINVASSEPISLKDCMGKIEEIVGNELILSEEQTEGNGSLYNISADWYMDCSKLEDLGIELEPIKNYLPRMIKSINC